MAKTKPKAKSKPRPKVVSGADEAAAFAAARALSTVRKSRWSIEISMDIGDAPCPDVYNSATDTRFKLHIYAGEWGLLFVHGGKVSHLRRDTDDFVHGSDGHALLKSMPALSAIGAFIQALETKHRLRFKRAQAHVRSNLKGAKAAIRDWLATI